MTSTTTIRIATRSSNLALWQARHISDLIRAVRPEMNVELIYVSTSGDRDQSERLRDLGGLGVFTREVQVALLDGRADLAVHSLKDLPTEPVEGLTLAATPTRGPSVDALVMPIHNPDANNWSQLPQGARVGTGSPRRQAQLKHLRPDLKLLEVRGNVETRLHKLDEGQFDALLLAAAGLTRLGLGNRISCSMGPPVLYPAVGQGAIGVECRIQDELARTLLTRITDPETLAAVVAERSLLSTLRAGCHAPLGAFTQVVHDRLYVEAVVLTIDGSKRWMASASGLTCDAKFLGQQVAQRLLLQGAQLALGGTNLPA